MTNLNNEMINEMTLEEKLAKAGLYQALAILNMYENNKNKKSKKY